MLNQTVEQDYKKIEAADEALPVYVYASDVRGQALAVWGALLVGGDGAAFLTGVVHEPGPLIYVKTLAVRRALEWGGSTWSGALCLYTDTERLVENTLLLARRPDDRAADKLRRSDPVWTAIEALLKEHPGFDARLVKSENAWMKTLMEVVKQWGVQCTLMWGTDS